jgi:hypothetical protein
MLLVSSRQLLKGELQDRWSLLSQDLMRYMLYISVVHYYSYDYRHCDQFGLVLLEIH